ncbi:MAG: alpha-amylase family glycosyl hydrolase [Pseudomonadota bacterium]
MIRLTLPRLPLRVPPLWFSSSATVCAAAVLSACTTAPALPAAPDYTPKPYVQFEHADWTRDAVIYQVNTRQFTAEGTFEAAEAELPRLADLGVDIIWLMPIHPIGEVNRKGPLGSPYAVKDFRAVNPELGTLDDFKSFVDTAHALGLKVIIDWVANHSAWDNALLEDYPEWYARDWRGDPHPPLGTDWSDVIEFDYDQPGLRQYMTEALVYWVRDVGIDGYRADVAGLVPRDFWETARVELNKVKPVFMLAEWESRDLHASAFDATYAWTWKDTMHPVARGEANGGAIWGYYLNQQTSWPRNAYRMIYTANHDQNSWDGTAPEIFGDAYEAAIVLAFTGEGMPLIYNGQEAFNETQLEFFERDPITWRDHPIEDLFRALIDLKTETTALHNGKHGARMVQVANSAMDDVVSFTRSDDNGGVFVAINLSDTALAVTLGEGAYDGAYTDHFTGETVTLSGEDALQLPAWGYKVLVTGAGD